MSWRARGWPSRWPTTRPVVLADEPTGELDKVTAERVLDLLDRLAEEGAAVLVVTHSPQVAARAHREIRLRDGQVQS